MFILMLMVITASSGIEQSRRDPAGSRRRHRAGAGALHVGHPAGEHRGIGADRTGFAVVHCRHLRLDARILTAGGILAFSSARSCFSTTAARYELSLRWIIPGTLLTAAFFVFVVSKGIGAQFQPAQTGLGTMVGKSVPAQSRIDSTGGRVFVEGKHGTPPVKFRWNRARPLKSSGFKASL